MKGYEAAVETRLDHAIVGAWEAGHLAQTSLKKYPPLKSRLHRKKSGRPVQTPEARAREMDANLRSWGALLKAMNKKASG